MGKIMGIANRRQTCVERQRQYSRAVSRNERILHNVKCFGLMLERVERGTDILGPANFHWSDLDAQHARCPLNLAIFEH